MITCRQLYLAIRRLTRLYSSLRKNTYCKAKTIQRILSPEQVYGTTMTNYNLTDRSAVSAARRGRGRNGRVAAGLALFRETIILRYTFYRSGLPLGRDLPSFPPLVPGEGRSRRPDHVSRFRKNYK